MKSPSGYRYAAEYSYASYRSECDAEMALEDMFACGEVSPAERPFIQRRGNRWHVMLWDVASCATYHNSLWDVAA